MKYLKRPSRLLRTPRLLPVGALVWVLVLQLAACAMPRNIALHDALPPESPRGYLEFYCVGCIAGWGVFRIENGEERMIVQQPLGRQLAASLNATLRMKRVRIAQEPGSRQYVIRLLPYAFLERDTSTKIDVLILENELTPIRINFKRETENTFRWSLRPGPSIPLRMTAESLQALEAGLDSPGWESRWYSVQVLGEFEGDLPAAILTRLSELAKDETYRECLKTATTTECGELREEAIKALKD
jgi:hypothetical protein